VRGEAFRRLEEEGWERAGACFARYWGSLTEQFVGPLLQALDLRSGDRLLDVGCGPGYLASAAADRGAAVVGVDFSAAMIREARRRSPALDFRRADAMSLPFAPGSFDRVTMGFTVPHLSDPERAFAEARRVLTPGGRLGFTVWAPPEDNPGARIAEEAIRRHADPSVDLPEGPPFFLFADRERCRTALARFGFDGESVILTSHRVVWIVPTKGLLFEAEERAGVRTAALLARQPPARRAAIREAIEEAVAPLAVPGGYGIPMTALLVVADVA